MDYTFLSKTKLFCGLSEKEIAHLLECINAYEKIFSKGETILRAGECTNEIGLVLSGSVNIVVHLYWGSMRIFGHISKGDIFAENYAAIPDRALMCNVISNEDSSILFINFKKLLSTCLNGCAFHEKIIKNLFSISANKSLALSSRMMHTAPYTIREKIILYLSEESIKNASSHFKIPFNREELANYLGVDRSALSAELGKMKKENLIEFYKNEFILKENL